MTTDEEKLEEVEPLASFITIAYDSETDLWTLDLGDVPFYEAKGILISCFKELELYEPELKVRHLGKAIDGEDDPPEKDW